MSRKLETRRAQAMQLDPADLVHLLERLLACLDTDPEVASAWEQETDRRENAFASGAAKDLPSHEALTRLRAKL